MANLQIYLLGLLKIIWNFKFLVFYIIVGLAIIGRWERDEKERMEKAIKRDKLKREYHQEHS